MDDQLTSAFESLIIRNQTEGKNEIEERLGIKEKINDSKNENDIRSPRSKGCKEERNHVFRHLQEPADTIIQDINFSENYNKGLDFDTVDQQSITQCERESLVKPTPRKQKNKTPNKANNSNKVLDFDTIDHQSFTPCKIEPLVKPSPSKSNNKLKDKEKSSGLRTPVENNVSLKKQPVRSSPRLNPNKEEDISLINDKIINDNIPDLVSLPSPIETPYHTPKIDEDDTSRRKNNDKTIWSTPQIKSRHQKRRINIKAQPEVISENVTDITTSTPFKNHEARLESPGLENIYHKAISPSVNNQSYSSLQSGYSSSEDVVSTESSVSSTPSISKANVSFGIAKVYCFDRCFGIDTVPEEGDFALGMSQVAWEALDCPIYDNSEELSKSMQKLTIDQRRILLEESCGSIESSKLDTDDDDSCKSPEIEVIRSAREKVGCQCVGACVPATCECALSEIECHVERAGWPCGCTKQRCKNPEGRRQYQPAKIKKETRIKIMQTVGKGNIRRSV